MFTLISNRLELHEKLVELLGSNEVYYQRPASKQMKYPAIVYSRSNIVNTTANNGIYIQKYVYMITIMDKNPDSPIVEKFSRIPEFRYDRHYESENINHDVFTFSSRK